jgi:hypothetical protein
MKIVIGAALGVLVLVASPASAQLYKAGTVTATPQAAQKDKPAPTQRRKSVVQPFYKAGSTTFMLVSPAGRQTKTPMDGQHPAGAEHNMSCCCKHDDAAACGSDHAI